MSLRFLLLPVLLLLPAAVAAGTAEETVRILKHGPWPPPARHDSSNRFSGHPQAVALGAMLFHDRRLSGPGTIACAQCHDPARAYAEERPVSRGAALLVRNAPSLLGAALQRWFGWDGAADSLWAASIRPILAPAEMAGSAGQVAALLGAEEAYACRVRALGAGGEAPLVVAGKALAAFQETLVPGRSPFDDYRDALAAGQQAPYPAAARRGLALFVGRADCRLCHAGPAFSNGEFADIGRRYFTAPGQVDPGRYGGLQAARASPYSRLGLHSDDPASGWATAQARLDPWMWGAFKVPSLRNVARTAPYMHDGSAASLAEVLRHYSEVDEDRLHADGERIVRALRLSAGEMADLAAFLESLSGPDPPPPALAPCP